MIHDLDIVQTAVGGEVTAIEAMGVPVLTDHVDIANVRLRFESGCIANLTASRISRDRVRKLRFFQRDAYVSVDCVQREVETWRVRARREPGARHRRRAAGSAAGRAARARARRLRRGRIRGGGPAGRRGRWPAGPRPGGAGGGGNAQRPRDVSGAPRKGGDRYRVANCTRAQPVFYRFGRAWHTARQFPSVSRANRGVVVRVTSMHDDLAAVLDKIEAGAVLDDGDWRALTRGRDLIELGMAADTVRRRRHGDRTTFLQVVTAPVSAPAPEGPVAADAGGAAVDGPAADGGGGGGRGPGPGRPGRGSAGDRVRLRGPRCALRPRCGSARRPAGRAAGKRGWRG